MEGITGLKRRRGAPLPAARRHFVRFADISQKRCASQANHDQRSGQPIRRMMAELIHRRRTAEKASSWLSASTTNHLPKSAVVTRYDDGQRVILRIDENREKAVDHRVSARSDDTLGCSFVGVIGP